MRNGMLRLRSSLTNVFNIIAIIYIGYKIDIIVISRHKNTTLLMKNRTVRTKVHCAKNTNFKS